MPIESLDCLTALAVGLHFARPRFGVANFFNDILDSFSDLPKFQIRAIGPHELAFRVQELTVNLNQNSLILRSHIFLGEKLVQHLPVTKSGEAKSLNLPTRIYTNAQIDIGQIETPKAELKNVRKEFLKNCIEVIKITEKIIQGGLSPLRFAGLVEYYAIPLDHVHWGILDKFTEQARFPNHEKFSDGKNTEKIAINRYRFPPDEDGIQLCFVFTLDKADETGVPNSNVASASFDFQLIPKEPKTIEGFGGPATIIKILSSGIQEMINSSSFMKIGMRDKK